MTYILLLKYLNTFFRCSLYFDTLIIQIDFVVTEIHSTDTRNYLNRLKERKDEEVEENHGKKKKKKKKKRARQ